MNISTRANVPAKRLRLHRSTAPCFLTAIASTSLCSLGTLKGGRPTLDSEEIKSFLTPEIESKITRYIRRIVRDLNLPEMEVEDIRQEVLIKLLAISNDRWNEIENVDGYLFKVARSQVLDHTRMLKRKLYEISLDEELEERIPTADYTSQARKTESGILLRHLSNSLKTPEERELLGLMIIGYNEKEIALRLGMTHVAARQRVTRLKAKLRHQIRTRQKQ